MITFKNLAQVLRRAGNQVNAQDLLNERIYVKGQTWVNIKLTDELRTLIADQLSDIYGGHGATRNRVFNRLNRGYNIPQHYTLSRMILERGKEPIFNYCAGQDYTFEMNQGRTDIKA